MSRVRALVLTLTIFVVSGVFAVPAAAVPAALASVVVNGPLRAGSFTQGLHASGSGLSAATMTAVAEVNESSSAGSLTVDGLVIASATSVFGQVSDASAPGTYFITLCITPKANPTCSAALAQRAFTLQVAGSPASAVIEPTSQTAGADVAATYAAKLYDASDRMTQLATGESLAVGVSASEGVVTVSDVDAPLTGLNPRLRVAGIGTFTLANDTAGTLTQAAVTSQGFVIDPTTVYLATDPPPHDISLVLDAPTSVTTLGATVTIGGVVLTSAGDPLVGAEVVGSISGTDTGDTTPDTTGADGRFELTFVSSSDTSGQHDEIAVTASEATHGSDSEEAVVYFTANGRSPISNLTIGGVPAGEYTGSMFVPYTGIALAADDTAVEVQVTAAVPGAPVEITTSRGVLTTYDSAAWSSGASSLVITTDARGLGIAYLHSTQIGVARLSVSASRVIPASVSVVSPMKAARDVDVSVENSQISAGQRDVVTVAVRDAFGNPVAESRVDISLAAGSPGRFIGGKLQVSVLTDSSGTAQTELVSNANGRGDLVVIARGDSPSCDWRNQLLCPINEPGAAFSAASGAQRVVVQVVGRAIQVTAPLRNARLSTNEFFITSARVTGVLAGEVALLKMGRREVARTRVATNGMVRFPAIRAVGDGVYAISVDRIAARVQVKVVAFGILGIQRTQGLALRVTPGAWARGTTIALTRNGRVVAKAKVLRPRQALVIQAPRVNGTYQVQVKTQLGIVPGDRAFVVR
jgi:hypothetical protein